MVMMNEWGGWEIHCMGRWSVTCTCIIYKALHLMLQALRHCRRIESELGTYLPVIAS